MKTPPNPCRSFRFPAEVIEHAVWLYHCFSPSLRDLELTLAARGSVMSHESIRDWGLRFGRLFANTLRRRRPRPGDNWITAAETTVAPGCALGPPSDRRRAAPGTLHPHPPCQ